MLDTVNKTRCIARGRCRLILWLLGSYTRLLARDLDQTNICPMLLFNGFMQETSFGFFKVDGIMLQHSALSTVYGQKNQRTPLLCNNRLPLET